LYGCWRKTKKRKMKKETRKEKRNRKGLFGTERETMGGVPEDGAQRALPAEQQSKRGEVLR